MVAYKKQAENFKKRDFQHTQLLRVNKILPCPVCGKPDWCLISNDGSIVICPRTSEGAERKCGDAGWLHILKDSGNYRPRRAIVTKCDIIDVDADSWQFLNKKYQNNISQECVFGLAKKLDVSSDSLIRLGIGWHDRSYTFAMYDGLSRIIGIHRRFPNGKKYCIPTSVPGLYLPKGLDKSSTILICEGMSDTAAALSLGFEAIGRYNCKYGLRMVANLTALSDVVVISDPDDAGIQGTKKLVQKLCLKCKSVRIIRPPDGIKDLRHWLENNVTKEQIEEIINNTEPVKIVIN